MQFACINLSLHKPAKWDVFFGKHYYNPSSTVPDVFKVNDHLLCEIAISFHDSLKSGLNEFSHC